MLWYDVKEREGNDSLLLANKYNGIETQEKLFFYTPQVVLFFTLC
jgi:hypothetical protein